MLTGSLKVMAQALGTSEDDAYHENLHQLSGMLRGNSVGLLFSHKKAKELKSALSQARAPDFARTGSPAPDTVTLAAGPLLRDGEPLPHSMEAFVRKLGLPTSLKNGVVVLERETTICREGEPLTSDQAHLLKLFGMKLADFSVSLLASYSKGKFKQLAEAPSSA